jgi:hypothetical protein
LPEEAFACSPNSLGAQPVYISVPGVAK